MAMFRRFGFGEEPPSEGDTEFRWEFSGAVADFQQPTDPGDDPQVVHPGGAGLLDAFRGPDGVRRVAQVRRQLDAALDRWWQAGTLPPLPLLRDGLLALEAGHDLDESHRSLLLRAALFYRKGMLTALAHQTDPERTAIILQEAVLNEERPLSTWELWRLMQEDPESAAWVPLLARELEEVALMAAGRRRQLARRALAQLQRDTPLPPAQGEIPPGAGSQRLRRTLLGLLLVGLLVLGMAQTLRGRTVNSVWIPAGIYPIAVQEASAGPPTLVMVELPALAMDRMEVTVAQYRRCYEAGACPWPAADGSATREDYFLNPAFHAYPVVHVSWDAARRYCAWAGKRLPTEAEWQVAAGYAPATGRVFVYPWGDAFSPGLANGLAGGQGDILPVGSYRPAGDSPFGLSDMAGNVAEWTATPAQPGTYVVKGGSFRDGRAQLQVAARRMVSGETAANWLGFRCVAPQTAWWLSPLAGARPEP